MKITLITVGKLKEKYWVQAVDEYKKRIGKYAKIELIEVADEKEPNNASEKDIEQIKDKEAERILAKIKDTQHVVTLEIHGKTYTSEKLAVEYQRWMNTGKSDVVFIIGGSNGLGEAVKKRSDQEISFGTLTYPHQMMKVMLMEQIFRVNKILRNEAYHK
ncbi:23S rRNA (pseudouridine(1915)-N(3))-methyltransferase RlmH [Lacicoccus alkaliphilus]|uniref:Ribosomal RNA large subunit methyltransferase H n=1 Tax=Lacicoccus alkaliphilus DSM 16010 TaxID=1123231 RepID=A0A1M7GK80_9BACL|nr:23S rRNA (pseudouridine(1915)-N(3))-methyltransferase RlmH [Salinicoccus alkaliphilus]SHM16802.1 23S rRNA (pseudouridine1915-N3)-methyltransferase [Salinicoccus alkaliphilus DSM 16010]